MVTRRDMMTTGIAVAAAGTVPGVAAAFESKNRFMTAQGERRTTTADNPYVIATPSLGLLNLLAARGAALLERDKADLGPLFPGGVQVSTQQVPKCNVLLLYGDIDASARISGSPHSLREAIKAAGAHIAVVASELSEAVLSSRGFAQALGGRNDWPANIVITLNRNGDSFGRFFNNLFSQMRTGVSMPMAWVNLAPQGPVQPKDIPGTIALMEAGHIAFGPKPG
jgi:hypothetical protein